MEGAALSTGLTAHHLQEIGRLATNCGMTEFLAELHMKMPFGVIEYAGHRALIASLSARRKLDLLEEGLPRIPNAAVRELVKEGCRLFGQA